MGEYPTIDFFAADYQKCATMGKEEKLEYINEQYSRCVELFSKDPFLKSFDEKKTKLFADFLFACNMLAAVTYTEISVAFHPNSNESSVILLGKKFDCGEYATAFLLTIACICKSISIEAIEDEGGKTMIFIVYSFDSQKDEVIKDLVEKIGASIAKDEAPSK